MFGSNGRDRRLGFCCFRGFSLCFRGWGRGLEGREGAQPILVIGGLFGEGFWLFWLKTWGSQNVVILLENRIEKRNGYGMLVSGIWES